MFDDDADLDLDNEIDIAIEIADATAARAAAIRADVAFCAAMRRAISLGLESPPVGVFRDTSPSKAGVFRTEAIMSGCGSPAAACADAAGADECVDAA
jgi:hypothetical protein